MNESLDSLTNLRAFQKDMGSVDIGMRKGKGVSKGIIDMRLGCKVKDSVNFLFS